MFVTSSPRSQNWRRNEVLCTQERQQRSIKIASHNKTRTNLKQKVSVPMCLGLRACALLLTFQSGCLVSVCTPKCAHKKRILFLLNICCKTHADLSCSVHFMRALLTRIRLRLPKTLVGKVGQVVILTHKNSLIKWGLFVCTSRMRKIKMFSKLWSSMHACRLTHSVIWFFVKISTGIRVGGRGRKVIGKERFSQVKG